MVCRWSGSSRRLGLLTVAFCVAASVLSAFSRSSSKSTAAISSSTASSHRWICFAVRCSFLLPNLCCLNSASSCSYFWLRIERCWTLESNCWLDTSRCWTLVSNCWFDFSNSWFDYAKDWCCIANCLVNSSSCSWVSWLKSGSVFMTAVCLRSWRRGNRTFGE